MNVLRNADMISRKQIREMIIREMQSVGEGDVVQMSDYMAAPEAPTAEEGSPFEMLLSKVHADMMEFMDENFESMTPEEGNFLDEMLDSIEDVLGISEEEGIEVPDYDDDVIGDIEDED
jgi:hypothetical protein